MTRFQRTPAIWSALPLQHRLGYFGLLCILLFFILLTVVISGKQTQTRQEAAGVTATGSFCPANIDYEGDGNYGQYNAATLSNPNIGAVDLSFDWSDIETQQGVFNWTPGDNEMRDWAAKGKMFTIVVRYIAEGSGSCTGQQYLPAWEIARIPHFCSTTGHIMPDYFDPTFTADLKAYAQAIADHIAASPYKNNLLYIRLGVGIGGESFPYPHAGTSSPDLTQLQQYGYTPTKWAAWQKDMMTSYKNSFSFAKVIYPLNSQDTDPATGQPVQVENAAWAAANGLGVGQQGLTASTNSPQFQQLRSQYPAMYIQYQTVGAVGSGAAGNVQAAEKNGAQFVEWYTSDILNSANQSAFAQFQQYVNGKFGNSCGAAAGNLPSPVISGIPTQPQTQPTPTLFATTPPWYCGGSQNCVPTGSPTPTIFGGVPTTTPADTGIPVATQPVSNSISPTTDPCVTSTQEVAARKKPSKSKKKQKNNNLSSGLLNSLLDLLTKLINLINQLMGNPVTAPTPTPGQPCSPTSSPTQSQTQPTDTPAASQVTDTPALQVTQPTTPGISAATTPVAATDTPAISSDQQPTPTIFGGNVSPVPTDSTAPTDTPLPSQAQVTAGLPQATDTPQTSETPIDTLSPSISPAPTGTPGKQNSAMQKFLTSILNFINQLLQLLMSIFKNNN